MAKKEKEYVAVHGIDFEEVKNKPRVEPGDPIPSDVPAAIIKELLADGHIKESE